MSFGAIFPLFPNLRIIYLEVASLVPSISGLSSADSRLSYGSCGGGSGGGASYCFKTKFSKCLIFSVVVSELPLTIATQSLSSKVLI